jgi:hypothetical protein
MQQLMKPLGVLLTAQFARTTFDLFKFFNNSLDAFKLKPSSREFYLSKNVEISPHQFSNATVVQ